MTLIFVNWSHLYNGVSPRGRAADFDSVWVGSIPAIPTSVLINLTYDKSLKSSMIKYVQSGYCLGSSLNGTHFVFYKKLLYCDGDRMIIDILLLIVAVCEFVQYVPQIIKILITKQAEDLQLVSWVTWMLSAYSYLAYLILQMQSLMLILVALFEAACCTIILILTRIYNKKNKNKNFNE